MVCEDRIILVRGEHPRGEVFEQAANASRLFLRGRRGWRCLSDFGIEAHELRRDITTEGAGDQMTDDGRGLLFAEAAFGESRKGVIVQMRPGGKGRRD